MKLANCLLLFYILAFACIQSTQAQQNLQLQNEANALTGLANALGFQWGNTTALGFCGLTSVNQNLRNQISCLNGYVSLLKIEDANTGCQNSLGTWDNTKYGTLSGMKVFAQLKELYVYNVQLPNNLPAFYGLNLTVFEYYGGQCVLTYPGISSDFQTDAKRVVIDGFAGNTPNFDNDITYLYVRQAPGTTLTWNLADMVNIIDGNIVSFELYLLSAPSGSFSDFTPLNLAYNLKTFAFQAPGYTITNWKPLFKPNPTLTTIILKNLTLSNNTFPDPSEVTWGNVQTLKLESLNLAGTVNTPILEGFNFEILSLNYNPSLNVAILDTFSTNSKIKELSISQTNINTPLPQNIINGDLQYLDVTLDIGLKNTTLPTSFLCLPPSYLLNDGVLPTYLLDPTYTNYWGPSTPRECTATLNPLVPNPIPCNSSYIFLQGNNMIGTEYHVDMTNTLGETFTLFCTPNNNSFITCYSPYYLQGQGELNLTTIIGITKQVSTQPFQFIPPSISKVSRIPTLGGIITIDGYDLMASNQAMAYESSVKINGKDCTKINVLVPFTRISCTFPAGVESGVPVQIKVKGQYNDPSNPTNFYYNAPTVTGCNSMVPNVANNLTITGMDFWNDSSVVTVTIGGSIDCPVLSSLHNIIVCSFPSSPFKAGSMNVQVTVNNQNSPPNTLFGFVDTQLCPNSCGDTTKCNINAGFCNCIGNAATGFGPSCDSVVVDSSYNYTVSTGESPLLSIKPTDIGNGDTVLNAYLVSVIENGAETYITSWNSTYNAALKKWTFIPAGAAKDIKIEIQKLNDTNYYVVGSTAINSPANSFTYTVTYNSAVPVKSLKFKFAMDIYPVECSTPPSVLAYPIGSSASSALSWLEITKYNITWMSRFPKAVQVNNGSANGQLLNSYTSGNGSTVNLMTTVTSSTSFVSHSMFKFDFTAYQADQPRIPQPPCNGTNVVPPKIIINTEPDPNKGKWKVTVGIVVAVVGAAIVGVGSFFIIRQRRQLNRTKSILDKKLSQLHLSHDGAN